MRPVMNEHTGNIVTQFFAIVAAVAGAMGISTQDLAYILFGAIGALVSIASFVFGRIDARHVRKEDEKRTQLLNGYIEHAKEIDGDPASLAVMNHVLDKMRRK